MSLSRRAPSVALLLLFALLAVACGRGTGGADPDLVSRGTEQWREGGASSTPLDPAGATDADVPPSATDPTQQLPVVPSADGSVPGQPSEGQVAPTSAPAAPVTPPGGSADLPALVAALTRDQLIGQMMVGVVFGDDADVVSQTAQSRNMALYGEATPAAIVTRYHLGGVVYLAHEGDRTSNVADLSATARLSHGMQQAAVAGTGIGLLIAADQEGGRVVRLREPATVFPAAREIGDVGDADLARRVGQVTGREALAVGVNWVLAPVADVNIDPANPVIGDRAFGVSVDAVNPMVAATAAGLWDAGALSSLKHYPGHGDTDVDSHERLPTITHSMDELRRIDLPPFSAGIAAVPHTTVMTGHLNVPAIQADIPATLSKPAIDLLRDELGFQGIVVTDAMNMGALSGFGSAAEVSIKAIEAGNDMILFPSEPYATFQAIRAALDSGRLTEARLQQSALRILQTKQAMGLLDASSVAAGDPSTLGSLSAQQVREEVRAACAC